jgi:hypothetical protein
MRHVLCFNVPQGTKTEGQIMNTPAVGAAAPSRFRLRVAPLLRGAMELLYQSQLALSRPAARPAVRRLAAVSLTTRAEIPG